MSKLSIEVLRYNVKLLSITPINTKLIPSRKSKKPMPTLHDPYWGGKKTQIYAGGLGIKSSGLIQGYLVSI
jgi:hypothetical protein